MRLVGLPLLALAPVMRVAFAVGPACPPPVAWHSAECPRSILAPRGLPSHGGTITIHAGIPAPCVVSLPGGVLLCAGGETALLASGRHGRVVFRISGTDWSAPGGVNIVASAAMTDSDRAPELLPQLNADAVVNVPPHAVLLRFEPGSGQFVPVFNGHIRQAALYKIVRRGAFPTLQPSPPGLPATLPATGASPLLPLGLVAACLLLAALWLGRDTLPTLIRRRRIVLPSTQTRLAAALLAGGTLLCVATGLTFVMMSAAADTGFGSLTEAGGAPASDGGARQPPTRLVVRRVGIDTTVVRLDIVGGAWQVPSFAAGYLAGAPWPGHTGNLVITGHDDQDGAVFQSLSELRSGDVVVVYAGAHTFRYAVTGLRVVAANRVDLLRTTRGATLTLITCAPYLVDTERLVVRARLLA